MQKKMKVKKVLQKTKSKKWIILNLIIFRTANNLEELVRSKKLKLLEIYEFKYINKIVSLYLLVKNQKEVPLKPKYTMIYLLQ